MSNKVEKGQKYKGGNGATYNILSEPFEFDNEPMVAYCTDDSIAVLVTLARFFENTESYTLIREPKFKVGDRIKWGWDNHGTIIAVSEDTDPDGDFGHLVKVDDGWFSLVHRPEAAE